MWQRPWLFKEGAAIGSALLAVGWLLQALTGNIDWEAMAFPVNAWLLGVLVALLAAMHCLRHKVYAFAWLGGYVSAVCSTALTVVVTVMAGFALLGTSSWPFVLAYLWLTVSLGLAVLRVTASIIAVPKEERLQAIWHRMPFMLNHIGLFTALVAATLGSADMYRLHMTVGLASLDYGPQAVAYEDKCGVLRPVVMDFALVLDKFVMEEYATGEPKRFASHVTVLVHDGDSARAAGNAVVEVNRPINVNGWKIYQYGYEQDMGKDSRYSVFEIVRDPWLPVVYAGIAMMLAGALGLLLGGKHKVKGQ